MTANHPPLNDTLDAFCTDTDAYLEGTPGSPLSGLDLRCKDIFDVAGHVTGGGNPDWKATHSPAERTAWIVQDPRGRRRNDGRQNPHRRAYSRHPRRERPLRYTHQPPRSRAGARRLLQRLGGGGRRQPRGLRSRLRTPAAPCASRPASAGSTACVPTHGADTAGRHPATGPPATTPSAGSPATPLLSQEWPQPYSPTPVIPAKAGIQPSQRA